MTPEILPAELPMGAVFRRDGQPITSSRTVADIFGKQHKNVLRDIDRIITMAPDLRLSFEPEMLAVPTGKGGTRHVRGYTMNKRGAALLIMGFTGPEALRWKNKLLDMFDHMAERERDNHLAFLQSMKGPSIHQQRERQQRKSLRAHTGKR